MKRRKKGRELDGYPVTVGGCARSDDVDAVRSSYHLVYVPNVRSGLVSFRIHLPGRATLAGA